MSGPRSPGAAWLRGGSVAAALVCASCASTARRGAGGPLAAGRPLVTPGDLDAVVLLADTPSRASSFGAGPLTLVAHGEASEGERLGAFVEVAPEGCLLAYARGSSSLDDIDVAIFDDEGDPLATDEAPDARPTTLLCPPHPGRVYVAAHAATGEGLIALGVQVVPSARAFDVARGMNAKGGLGRGPRAAEAWPGLDDRIRARRALLGGRWEEVRKAALVLDARAPSYLSYDVEDNQCVDALIVPDEEVALLDVEALDEAGRSLARALEAGEERTFTLCATARTTVSLVVRPRAGRGLSAVVLARTPSSFARELASRTEVVWSAPEGPLEAARGRRDDALDRAGYGASFGKAAGQLTAARRTSLPFEVAGPPGACARLDVTTGAPLARVDATAWDDAGTLLADGFGSRGATLFSCARGKARLELETFGPSGPYAVAQRNEPWRDPAFAAYPVAAARMLTRAADGAFMLLPGDPLAVRKVTLTPGQRVSWDEPLAAGRCVQVSVGAEGEGIGVELRLFDQASGNELDRARAEHAVTARACAEGKAARTLRVELRGSSGSESAIVGERLLRAPVE